MIGGGKLRASRNQKTSELISNRDPHVGLPVCMDAYYKVPQRMRDRLSGLTGGGERFVGGSVDTMYIPGHLRNELLDTLAIFLETSCFLEIVSLVSFCAC
jgi:hypothetical protein